MTKSTLLLYTTVWFNFISFWWIRRLHKMEFKQIETHFCTHFTLRRTFMYHLEVLLAMSPFLPIFTKCCSLLRSSSSLLRSRCGAALEQLQSSSSHFAFWFGDFRCVAPEQLLFGSSDHEFQKEKRSCSGARWGAAPLTSLIILRIIASKHIVIQFNSRCAPH